MTLPVHTVRRANINDLAALRTIWSEERFPVGELERRFTEFQVIEAVDGKVIAALALQIQGKEGHVHSEAIAQPEHAELARQVLWDRLKKVAINHGLVRVWTHATHTHWQQEEFSTPTEEQQGKRPAQFGESTAGWLVLQLKEESAQAISLEHELAMFREAQKAESQEFQQRAQKMRLIATVVAFLFLACVLVGGFYWFQYYKDPEKYKKREDLTVPAPPPPAGGTNAVPPTNALPALKPAPLPAPQTNQTIPDSKTPN
jgi:hypothetical protein